MTRFLATVAAMAVIAAAVPARAGDAPQIEFLNSGEVTPTTLPFSEAVRAWRSSASRCGPDYCVFCGSPSLMS